MSALRAAILRGARRTRGVGEGRRGTRATDGYVFDRVRGYVEGDDPRRVDWAATARIGALQTRVFLEETELVLGAIVDESPSMTVGRKRPLAAAANDAVRAWFGAAENADRTRRLVDERVIANRRAALEVRATTPFRLDRSLELAVRALPRGSSLLLVTDGFDLANDPATDDLLLRCAHRCDATVLVAHDPWADALPLRGFVRLRDAETGATKLTFVGRRTRERYRVATAQREADLRARFERAGWRVGALDEADGEASLERAFGLR